jgi:raffinose/stachyose/melibiose transport system permease protein
MSRRGQFLFFAPGMIVFLVLVLLPATQTWIDSVSTLQQGRRIWMGFELYQLALHDSHFQQAISTNVQYFAWTLLFEVAVGMALAVGLERESVRNQILRVIFFAPSVLSLVVVGLVFGFLFKDGVGLLPGWLNASNAVLTASVVSGWASAGFFMVIFLGGLAGIPQEVIEAAQLDGASRWQLFWRIQLPLLREVSWVALLVCFTGAFKAFDLFWVLFRNQEEGSIVATLLVKEFFQFNHPAYGSTLAVLLTVLVVGGTLIGLAIHRWRTRRLEGAEKQVSSTVNGHA